MRFILVTCLFSVLSVRSATPAIQIQLSSYKNAKCLDGTPGDYYIDKTKSTTNMNKWYIHFEGGGWCAADDETIGNSPFNDCLSRSATYLGSTKADKPQENITGVGPFDNDPARNPMMYDWNHVYIRYCDGASFSGDIDMKVVVDTIHSRGHSIAIAAITDLLTNQGLNTATDVVIGGCSAGGLAMYLHIDEIADLIKQNSQSQSPKIRGLIDSGFFVDIELPTSQFEKGFRWIYQNTSVSSLNKKCLSANSGSEWKCMFPQYSSQYITTPVFILQSKYDCWQAIHVEETKDETKLNQYGKTLQQLVYKSIWSNARNGGILDSCYHHCGDWNAIVCNGKRQPEAFEGWYNGGNWRCDMNETYPANSGCPSSSAGCY